MSQFVDQCDARLPRQECVEIHLFEHDAAILDLPSRHSLQVADLLLGFRPAVRFDVADDDVDALPLQAVGFLQHFVGLADAGREAEIDLEPPPLLLADHRQKSLGGDRVGV